MITYRTAKQGIEENEWTEVEVDDSPKDSSRTSVIFREAANDAWICFQFAESWKTSKAKQVDFTQLSLRARELLSSPFQ